MNEKSFRPSPLRLAAAVFLGLIVGFILFFVVALFIGMFNAMLNMDLPVRMDIAENIISAVLLVVFEIVCIAGFVWKVWVTPPTEPESEEPGSEE
ncbi:MAG: hypothetical protein WC342_05920 [Methanoregula sp.]